ncbi:hypothetical protein HN924_01380 [Candidatus Woesearchaeota archaeon]|jgi:hypothetical protein|nr:hypothetical protein [Candidatus Woesearchaeota archaeon]MBT7062600.1 hypothetical protein [Candidatus Woesearchaeota archaeon]MBT7402759.1 hypothetical protein [Candidatus Woesearchaeota archaeon]
MVDWDDILDKIRGEDDEDDIPENETLSQRKERRKKELAKKKESYKNKWGLFKGKDYRKKRKADFKSSLKEQRFDLRNARKEKKFSYRAGKKEERLQKRLEKSWGLKLLLSIGAIISLFVMNYLPSTFSLVLLVAIIAIILFISYTKFAFAFGLVLVVLLIFAYWMFFFTPYGTDLVSEFEKSNVVGETEEALEESGVEHQFNIIGKILSGDFEPEELWTSEAVESEYAVQEEFDIVLKNIEPRKEYFKNSEAIYLTGNINLISGFDKTTIVTITTEPDDFCAENSQEEWDEFLEKVSLGRISDDEKPKGCSDGSDWECYISGSDEVNTFHMERIYNRQLYCNHTGVRVDEEEIISNLKVNWEYATTAVAGKQIYAFDSEIVSSYDGNPLDKYEIAKDSYTSWYIGDRQINLGLGLTGSEDYVRGEDKDDSFREVTDLVITVQNTGSGKISDIESLSISFPNTEMIQVGNEIEDALDSNVLFTGPTTEIIAIRGEDIITRKFTLSDEGKREFETIEPADHMNFYIPFVVTEEYIGNSAFQSFLVKAEVSYKYRDHETTAVTIKP